MSLKNRYRQIDIYRLPASSDYTTDSQYSKVGSFKGLIQTPAPSNTFNQGKETATIAAVLFCDIKEQFTTEDVIFENGNGYKIANSNLQKNGVCGLTPKAGQHAEYNLTYVQGGIV